MPDETEKASGMTPWYEEDAKLSYQGAAEHFWKMFIEPLQGD